MISAERKIIFFDGDCHLCNGFVQFVIRRDTRRVFYFSSLQSAYGKEFLIRCSLSTSDFKTIYLYNGRKVFSRSSAVLRIIGGFGGGYTMAYLLLAVPGFIRDGLYDYISQNRYLWFGKSNTCLIPGKNNLERFIL